ncbi:hypothetical protein HK100_008686, partial [Physocladia obscura]
MGARQSSMINKKLSVIPPTTQQDLEPAAGAAATATTTQEKSSPSTPQSDSFKRGISIPQSPPSQTEKSKKYELKAAYVNTVVAKTWNPNDPKSWEPEMREYHELPNSDYMLPSDVAEQNRLEMQHYIFRAAFQG